MNIWAGIHLVSAVMALAAAVFLVANARRRIQNHLLALMLATWGFLMLTRASALATNSASVAEASWASNYVWWALTVPATLAFVGTMPSPWVRPFSTPLARWSLLGLAVAFLAYWFAGGNHDFVLGVYEGAFFAKYGPAATRGWMSIILIDLASLVASLYGLVVAIDLRRRARTGSMNRRQADGYLLAFGAFDFMNLLLFSGLFYLWDGGTWGAWVDLMNKPEGANAWEAVLRVAMTIGWPIALIVLTVLLSFAVLRMHLFGIELKVKWGLRRGAVSGMFIVAFTIASATAQIYFEQYGVVVGGVAVGLLLFAIRPIERLADRMAEKALPGVADTPEYHQRRKEQIYRAAVEGALGGGGINSKERGMLAALAEELGLGPKDMHAVEQLAHDMHVT